MNPKVEKILKLPVYQRLIILCVLLLVLVGAFVYVLYLPKQKELRDLQEQSRSLQTKLEQDRLIANNLPKFKAEYEKMGQQLELALTELPNQKEIPSLLTSIASLAKDNGLQVLSFRPSGETARGFYAEVPVKLSIAGSYHAVALFFQAVGDLSRIVNIGNVTIGNAKRIDGRVDVKVDCLATTFRFLEGE